MNNFVKYFVIPATSILAPATIAGGITYNIAKDHGKEQGQIRYEQGYRNALTNEAYYKEQLQVYSDLVDDQNHTISYYSTRVYELNALNEQKETQINLLTAQLTQANANISDLQGDNMVKSAQISDKERQIVDLQNRITTLSNTNVQQSNQIVNLNIQISNLQTQISSLQTSIELNNATIRNLTEQASGYQAQIELLQNEIKNNALSVKEYTDRISKMERTINYYETFIASQATAEQSVVRFTYDDSLYNLQIVSNGNCAVLTNPTNTPYIQFNYWTINGVEVDPSEYAITENTEFVANLTYKYDVKFMVDNACISSQIITDGSVANAVSNPTKDNYTFAGWTINGIDIIDPATTIITQDTTFTAVFVQMRLVNFVSEGEVVSTQSVQNGYHVVAPTIESTTYKVFNGWKSNDLFVDLDTFIVLEDTTLTADFTYKYDVNFVVDEETTTQIVESGLYASTTPPQKDGYDFIGWSIDGENVIDLLEYPITQNTTFTALFEVSASWHRVVENRVYSSLIKERPVGSNTSFYLDLSEYADIIGNSLYKYQLVFNLYIPVFNSPGNSASNISIVITNDINSGSFQLWYAGVEGLNPKTINWEFSNNLLIFRFSSTSRCDFSGTLTLDVYY